MLREHFGDPSNSATVHFDPLRLAGYDKVLVVATDRKALAKVERKLAATGLLGLTRVVLVLANG